MKKKVKKLRLDRETIRLLQENSLVQAAGAFYVDSHYDHTCGSVCDIPSWHCTYCSEC